MPPELDWPAIMLRASELAALMFLQGVEQVEVRDKGIVGITAGMGMFVFDYTGECVWSVLRSARDWGNRCACSEHRLQNYGHILASRTLPW